MSTHLFLSTFSGPNRSHVGSPLSQNHFPFFQVDLTYFPKDIQECALEFESTYNLAEMELHFHSLKPRVKQSAAWAVQFGDKQKFYVHWGPNVYPVLRFEIGLQRRSYLFDIFIVLPSIALSFITAWQFLMPVDSRLMMSEFAFLLCANESCGIFMFLSVRMFDREIAPILWSCLIYWINLCILIKAGWTPVPQPALSWFQIKAPLVPSSSFCWFFPALFPPVLTLFHICVSKEG